MQLVALGLISVLLLGPLPGAGSPNHATEPPAALLLTNEHPSGDFPIAPETMTAVPPILVLRVKSVSNPSQLGIHLLVYFVIDSRTGGSRKMLLGDVGFYPPDHPSGFLLRFFQSVCRPQLAPPNCPKSTPLSGISANSPRKALG